MYFFSYLFNYFFRLNAWKRNEWPKGSHTFLKLSITKLPFKMVVPINSPSCRVSWRRKWQPTPVFLPRKSHGWRSLVGYSPWCCKELDTTERLHFRAGYEAAHCPSHYKHSHYRYFQSLLYLLNIDSFSLLVCNFKSR